MCSLWFANSLMRNVCNHCKTSLQNLLPKGPQRIGQRPCRQRTAAEDDNSLKLENRADQLIWARAVPWKVTHLGTTCP